MPQSTQASAKKFKELYVEAWPPQARDAVLSNFTTILKDEEWYHEKTMEMPEVGSYNPKKISSLLNVRDTEAQLAVIRCKELTEQLWEGILQQSISAEDFYVSLSGSVEAQMQPKSFDYATEEY